VRIDLVGPMTDTSLAPAVDEAVKEGWCTHTQWLTPEQLVPFCSGAGLGLIPYLPVPNYLEALPTKMFEYMAMGIPVLASDFPFWRELVRETGSGRVASPDPSALAKAIGEMLAAPEALARFGAQGKEAYRRRYRWETEQANLRWHLERAMARRRRG
jgi:glycosyltransferase involved in cell wall biosynthesis